MKRASVIAAAITLFLAVSVTAQVAERQTNNPGAPGKAIQGDFVGDPSFEAGTPNPSWTEMSTNFGTPLCTVAGCGTGTGTGPNTGTWWAWFGGISIPETGSVSQSVTMPDLGIIDLTFWFEAIVCDSASDFLEVRIDGAAVWSVDGSSPLCGVLGYSQQTADLSAFRNQTVTLEFFSQTFAVNQGGTNFFVDDVDIDAMVPVELQLFQVD